MAFKFGWLCMVFTLGSLYDCVRGTVGTDCSANHNACTGAGETCDTGTTNKCICDLTGYTDDSGTCRKDCSTDSTICDSVPGTKCEGGFCRCDGTNNYVDDGSGTCKKDCGKPAPSTGYIPESSPTSTLEGAIANVACDTVSGYSGSSPQITCQTNGSWTGYSGCSKADGGGTGTLGTDCARNTPACTGEGQICDIGKTDKCVCDAANGYITESGTCKKADGGGTGTLGSNCAGNAPACTGVGEICDTGNTDKCVCDAANGYITESGTCKKRNGGSQRSYSLLLLIAAFVTAVVKAW